MCAIFDPTRRLMRGDLASGHRNDKAVITLNGMQADCSNFVKRLKQRLEVRIDLQCLLLSA